MRARKTQLITELEQEKQRLEMEVHKMQKLKDTKVTTKISAGNIHSVRTHSSTTTTLFRFIIAKRFRACTSVNANTRGKCS